MKKIIVLLGVLLVQHNLSLADPGIGLVKDRKGNIFYTDLARIWKISPDGKTTVVLNGVHTHSLSIDSNDNLFGEHLWYKGDQSPEQWGNYAWRLSPEGKLDTVKGPINGFLENYSFVRDASGNMYYLQHFKPNRFKKIAPDGTVTLLAETDLNPIGWRYVTPGGTLYFISGTTLYRIGSEGKIETVASDFLDLSPEHPITGENGPWIGGIWSDPAGNIYVANYTGQNIKKISLKGTISTIATTETGWSPSYGLFDDQGKLWVMEYNDKNEVRVHVHETDAPQQQIAIPVSGKSFSTSLYWGLVLGAFVALSGFFVLLKRKRKSTL